MRDELETRYRRLKYLGSTRYCPICQSHVRAFLPAGVVPRPNAQCPVCFSVERHRLDWLFFQRKSNLWDAQPKRMLHIAPEVFIQRELKRIKRLDYLSGDFQYGRQIMVQLDLTAVPCPSGSFDVLYCSHVLEHVPEDRRALREFRRVLKPGGWAVLHIPPLKDGLTFEDPKVINPVERARLFGQCDHVRRYGCDFPERLIEAGLSARFVSANEVASVEEMDRMGIPDWEGFWLSTNGSSS